MSTLLDPVLMLMLMKEEEEKEERRTSSYKPITHLIASRYFGVIGLSLIPCP